MSIEGNSHAIEGVRLALQERFKLDTEKGGSNLGRSFGHDLREERSEHQLEVICGVTYFGGVLL